MVYAALKAVDTESTYQDTPVYNAMIPLHRSVVTVFDSNLTQNNQYEKFWKQVFQTKVYYTVILSFPQMLWDYHAVLKKSIILYQCET
jgi:cellulose biosynthesis protein BcsQ